jgi:hypothetical protein
MTGTLSPQDKEGRFASILQTLSQLEQNEKM